MPKHESDQADPAYEGRRIREIRKAKGITMKQLAASMDGDVHFTTIAKIETGKMRLSTEWLRRIALALDVTPLELVWDKYARESVKSVPLFASKPWPPEKGADGKWIMLGHTPTMLGSEQSFAVAIGGPADNLSDDPLYQVVIEPEYSDLRDGQPYGFVCKESVRVGIYRENPARFEQWLSERVGVMLVGSEPFELLGRLIWLNRNLF